MARVKLQLPSEFLFTTQIPVRVTDLNYGEHVGNDTILSIMHEARMQFLTAYGFDEGKIVHQGVGLIMADVAVQYKAEIFYGSSLEIKVTPTEFTSHGFELFYYLYDSKTKVEYARAKSGMVCFSYETRKILSLPPEIKGIWKI